MKGFKPTGKTVRSGHHFSDRDGFSGSSGKVQAVKGYTRRVVCKADGGKVNGPGNAVNIRTEGTTDADQHYGGKTPLRTGYKEGGRIPGEGPQSDKEQDMRMIKGAIQKHVAAPKPAGHGVNRGKGFNRSPLIGK